MLGIAILLFVIAAGFGLYVLTVILKDRPTPKPAVFTHGPIAALALILVLVYMYQTGHTEPLLLTSVALFVLAAIGGLTLFTIDMSNRPIPKMIALVHPVVAVLALVTLIIYVLQ